METRFYYCFTTDWTIMLSYISPSDSLPWTLCVSFTNEIPLSPLLRFFVIETYYFVDQCNTIASIIVNFVATDNYCFVDKSNTIVSFIVVLVAMDTYCLIHKCYTIISITVDYVAIVTYCLLSNFIPLSPLFSIWLPLILNIIFIVVIQFSSLFFL